MKRFFSLFIAIVLSLFFFPLAVYAAADPYEPIHRGEFAKKIAQTLFSKEDINACDGNTLRFRDVLRKNRFFKYICSVQNAGFMKGFADDTFQPAKTITLAEVASVLVKVFHIPLPRHSELVYQYRKISSDGTEELVREQPKWFKGPLVALGRAHAIPPSFFDFRDSVTHAELEEMIHRLKNNVSDKPYREFTSQLDVPDSMYDVVQDAESRRSPMLRLFGDMANIDFGKAVLKGRSSEYLTEPNTYQIQDLEYDPDSSIRDECSLFRTDSVSVMSSGADWNIELKGHSAGLYCAVVSENVDKEEGCAYPQPGQACTCVGNPDGSEKCTLMTSIPYALTLKKEGSRFRVEGAQTNRLRIFRLPLEKLPFEFGTNGPFYDQTRVETRGTLTITSMPDSRQLFTYRTPWRSAFQDMRGVPYLAFEKSLEGGGVLRKFYDTPVHNMNPYGAGITDYKRCLENPVAPLKNLSFQFCFQRKGKDFVVSSYLELSDRVTFWIDEHFKR